MACPSRIGDDRLARTARVARDPGQPSRILPTLAPFPLADPLTRPRHQSGLRVPRRAKPIMFFTILAVWGQGDEVLYPDPSFPMYESIPQFAGAVGVPIPLRERNGFRIDTDELERLVTERSKLLIINSPHNPCGSSLSRADCEAIADIAQRHDLIVLADEGYWPIRYGQEPHPTVLDGEGLCERTILLAGWSKTFAMTGWRLGLGVFPS